MNKQEIETAVEAIKKFKHFADLVESPDEYFQHMQGHTKELSLVLNVFDVADLCDDIVKLLNQQLTNGWIPCVERLPGNDNPVLATARRKNGARGYFIYKACYVAPKTKTTEDYGWDIDNVNVEYDEGKDCYWIPECWYEDNAVEDNANWILDDDFDVVAWQPLPEPMEVSDGQSRNVKPIFEYVL